MACKEASLWFSYIALDRFRHLERREYPQLYSPLVFSFFVWKEACTLEWYLLRCWKSSAPCLGHIWARNKTWSEFLWQDVLKSSWRFCALRLCQRSTVNSRPRLTSQNLPQACLGCPEYPQVFKAWCHEFNFSREPSALFRVCASRRLKAHSFNELRSHPQRQARGIKVLFELTCEFYKELGILETWEFISLNYLFVFQSAWIIPPANSSKCRNLPAEGFCRFQFNSSGKSPSHHRISVISSAARYQPPTGKLKGEGVTPWRPGNWFLFIVNATVCISSEGQKRGCDFPTATVLP